MYIKNVLYNFSWQASILSKYIDFEGHADEKYLVDSRFYLPDFASMYNINIIWYDVNQVMTYACIFN